MKKLCLFEKRHVDEGSFGKTEVGGLKVWCMDCEEKYGAEVCESWSYTRNAKLYSEMKKGQRYWRWCTKHKFYSDVFGSEEGCLICKFKEKKGRKWTIETVREIVRQKGFELHSDEYKNVATRIQYKCKRSCLNVDRWEIVTKRGVSCSCFDNNVKEETKYRGLKTKYARNKIDRDYTKTVDHYPEFIEQWSNKNEKSASEYTRGSTTKVWWKCLAGKGHPDYKSQICKKTIRNQGCPYCSNKKVCNENSLKTRFPSLSKEWSERNEKGPEYYTPGTSQKVWWRCMKNKGHPDYLTSVNKRTYYSRGCPYCASKKVCLENSFGINYRILSKEWSKKNKQGAHCYTPGSNQKVWWRCMKSKHHPDYLASISSRVAKSRGCPYCCNQKVCEENCLKTKYPSLSKEWSMENEKGPEYYVPGSNQKIWWKCIKNKHHPDYSASIHNRTFNLSGCPRCRESHGEKALEEVLNSFGISSEKKRETFFTKGERKVTEWDRVFETDDKKVVFEFDGEQHFETVKYFHKGRHSFTSQLKRDAYKHLLCYKKGYYLCRIHYQDLKAIKLHITKFIDMVEASPPFIYLSRHKAYQPMTALTKDKVPHTHFFVDPNIVLREFLEEKGDNFNWKKGLIVERE